MTSTTLPSLTMAAPGRPGLVARLAAAFARYRANHQAITRLHCMSDHQLADIGLTRDQIRYAVLSGRPR